MGFMRQACDDGELVELAVSHFRLEKEMYVLAGLLAAFRPAGRARRMARALGVDTAGLSAAAKSVERTQST